jgi:ribosomal protein L35AE/L33A
MNAQEISRALITGQFSNEELIQITEALKFTRAQLGQRTKASLAMGDNVSFHNSKQGRDYTGTVVKIASKFVTVRTVNGLWRVPASMLTVV